MVWIPAPGVVAWGRFPPGSRAAPLAPEPPRGGHAAKTGDLYLRQPSAPAAKAGPDDGVAWPAYVAEARTVLAQAEALGQQLRGRIGLLRFVVVVSHRPPKQWGDSLGSLAADQIELATAVLRRLALKPELKRDLIVVGERYEEAMGAARDVRELLAAAPGLGAEDRAARMAALPLPKLRGKVYGLTTLDLIFRDDPVLGPLFPPIERKAAPTRPVAAASATAPSRETRPLTATPAATAPLDAVAGKLREGVDWLLRGRS